MKVYAIIPAYNEAARIRATVLGVRQFVDTVIAVDDGSFDGTAEAARAAGAIVVRHAVNRGQGAALKTGTDAALRLGAGIIVHIDADGQHDPSLIPSLIQPLKEGKAEIALGSRFMSLAPGNMPWIRRRLLGAARTFNSLVMGIPRSVTDPQSGMRAFMREAAMAIDIKQDRMAHCSEILRLVTRSGLRWVEVPIRVNYTADSLAKGQKSADALKIVWQLFLGALRD